MGIFLDQFMRVKAAVAAAEEKSSVEFVSVFKQQASSYFYFRMNFFFLGLFVAYFCLKNFNIVWPLAFEFLFSVLIGCLCFGLVSLRAILGFLLPVHYKHEKVEALARASFIEEGVFETKGRTGLLILVCELERSVFILTDKAISDVIPENEITLISQKIAKDFEAHLPGESFLDAIEKLTTLLAEKFPTNAENKNELSDKVRR